MNSVVIKFRAALTFTEMEKSLEKFWALYGHSLGTKPIWLVVTIKEVL